MFHLCASSQVHCKQVHHAALITIAQHHQTATAATVVPAAQFLYLALPVTTCVAKQPTATMNMDKIASMETSASTTRTNAALKIAESLAAFLAAARFTSKAALLKQGQTLIQTQSLLTTLDFHLPPITS
jgi:hypothetical protein